MDKAHCDSTLKRIRCFNDLRFLGLYAALALASDASAGAAEWSSTNTQYLYGNSHQSIFFDTGAGRLDSRDDTRSIVTLEHVNGKDLSLGVVKDVLVTTTTEIGDGFHNYLYGLAVDLDLPGTPVFQINYYIRNEIGPRKDRSNQLTLVWPRPTEVGGLSFAFEGLLDYAHGMNHVEDNLLTAPRLLLDVGKFGGSPGNLQAGVEYQVWRNKFGLDGIDEDAPQAMPKLIW